MRALVAMQGDGDDQTLHSIVTERKILAARSETSD